MMPGAAAITITTRTGTLHSCIQSKGHPTSLHSSAAEGSEAPVVGFGVPAGRRRCRRRCSRGCGCANCHNRQRFRRRLGCRRRLLLLRLRLLLLRQLCRLCCRAGHRRCHAVCCRRFSHAASLFCITAVLHEKPQLRKQTSEKLRFQPGAAAAAVKQTLHTSFAQWRD